MKRRIIIILRWIYSKMLEYKFTLKLRRKAKQLVKKYRARKFIRLNKETFSGIGHIDPDDVDVEVLETESGSDTFAFGYDVLGLVKGLAGIDYVEYCSDLADILENNDINFRLALISEEEKKNNEEAVSYFREKANLYMISPGEGVLVKCGDAKVFFFSSDFPRYLEEDEQVELSDKVIKQLAYAKQQKADSIVHYGLREIYPSTKFSSAERRYLRKLADLGVDDFFSVNEFGIHKGKNRKRLDGSFANSVASLGCLFGSKENDLSEEALDAAVAVRIKLLNVAGEQTYVKNRGYIPLYNAQNDDQFNQLVRADYHNTEHSRNSNLMASLNYVERHMAPMRDIRNQMTIGDICDVLEVQLPEKYKDYTNISVNKICARSFEVAIGDVLFFREPFDDPNDGEPKPLEARMRIVEKSLDRGARFVFSFADLGDDIPHMKLDNCREAHIKICAHLRQFYEVQTIGITGSVGKTSTKDMLYNVFAQKYRTYRNLRNSNTQVNIGMHVQSFTSDYEIFIQEIGGGRPGGASRHSRMILPEAVVVTNIGQAHIGNFGSQEKLMESKLGIIDGLTENGVLYLNGDDPLLSKAKVDAKTVYFAVNNHDADYYADNIVESDGVTDFEIVHGDHRVPARINVLGEYNVLNAVCCYAIGQQFDLTDKEITDGLLEFETSGTRQNLVSVGGYNLFIDCFNASPSSMESSLAVLDAIETDHKKIAVLGYVTGMGELAEEMHEEIGKIVTGHHPDVLVCYGEEAKPIYDMAVAAGMNAISITKAKALNNYLREEVQPGDVILFKGSSKTFLSERIDEVYGTMMSDQRYIDSHKYRLVKFRKLDYFVYEHYASAMNCRQRDAAISAKVARKVMGVPVYSLNEGLFANYEELIDVNIPDTVRHIGDGCFSGCGAITSIDLSKGVKYIGEKAFAGCTSLKEIRLGDSLIHIADNAFEDCSALGDLYIPESVKEIGEKIFLGCENIRVHCKKGSYAEQYCIEQGIEHVLI